MSGRVVFVALVSKLLIDMDQLVERLIASGVLKTPAIITAFRTTDRRWFVRSKDEDEAYGDYPLPLGYGQTISQPTTVAFMLELLRPQIGEAVLDVGSGSGWTTALLAVIVGPTGRVRGVELVPELVTFGRENLKRAGVQWATIDEADAELGLAKFAPYDRILVSAAADVLPPPLVEQLRPGGTMVLPVGHAVWRLQKDVSSLVTIEKFEGFSFVPLVSSS